MRAVLSVVVFLLSVTCCYSQQFTDTIVFKSGRVLTGEFDLIHQMQGIASMSQPRNTYSARDVNYAVIQGSMYRPVCVEMAPGSKCYLAEMKLAGPVSVYQVQIKETEEYYIFIDTTMRRVPVHAGAFYSVLIGECYKSIARPRTRRRLVDIMYTVNLVNICLDSNYVELPPKHDTRVAVSAGAALHRSVTPAEVFEGETFQDRVSPVLSAEVGLHFRSGWLAAAGITYRTSIFELREPFDNGIYVRNPVFEHANSHLLIPLSVGYTIGHDPLRITPRISLAHGFLLSSRQRAESSVDFAYQQYTLQLAGGMQFDLSLNGHVRLQGTLQYARLYTKYLIANPRVIFYLEEALYRVNALEARFGLSFLLDKTSSARDNN